MKFMRQFVFMAIMLLTATANATTINKVYIFGDSLSDNGNLYALSGQIIPAKPYFNGHFSNGLIWPELLMEKLQMSQSQLEDYAFGGAETHSQMPPGLLIQAENYLSEHAQADPDGLYVVWIGANNYIYNPESVEENIAVTIGDIKTVVSQLAERGARHFLVPNIPDIGITPWAHKEDSVRQSLEFSKHMHEISLQHNDELKIMLAELREGFANNGQDVDILEFDIFTYLSQAIANPESFGINNVVDSCFDGGLFGEEGSTLCDDPNSHLFWDFVHPTTKIHGYIAEYINNILLANDYHGANPKLKHYTKPSLQQLRAVDVVKK